MKRQAFHSRAAGALWICGVCWLASGACASVRGAPDLGAGCAPPTALRTPWREDPASPRGSSVDDIAALLGVSEGMRELAAAPKPETRAAQIVLERVGFARTVADATTAELDCESERADQLAAYLDARERQSTGRFTVASLLVGAATTIASVLLALENTSSVTQGAVAVGGG